MNRMAIILWALFIGLTLILSQNAVAGKKKSCDECGCEKMKKVPCPVRTYEPVELPIYECTCQDVFFPKKGQVCTTQFRCDTYVKLHKHCEPMKCDCTETCSCKTWCTYETERGCKTMVGASPLGCTGPCTVKHPTGERCTKLVPVVKWVMVPVCSKCKACCTDDKTLSLLVGPRSSVAATRPARVDRK